MHCNMYSNKCNTWPLCDINGLIIDGHGSDCQLGDLLGIILNFSWGTCKFREWV